MAFLSNLDIPVSGMIAQRTRLDVIGHNVANADTTRTEDGTPYVRQCVVFTENKKVVNDRESVIEFRSMVADRLNELRGLAGKDREFQGEGVLLTQIVEDETPLTPVYDPTHPDADEDGYYYLPNVDVPEEQMDALAASQSYTSNLTIFNSMKAIIQKALTIGQ